VIFNFPNLSAFLSIKIPEIAQLAYNLSE